MEEGRTEKLLPMLAAGEIDLIVGRLYQSVLPDAFEREELWSEPMSLLARNELVLPTVTQRMGQEIAQLLHRLGLVAGSSYKSNSAVFIREMLHGGDFLTVLPRLMMVGDILRGSLRLAPLPIASPERPAEIIRRGDAPTSPAARAFVDVLRTYVADLRQRGITSF
jgi:LysR family pca operon transcriptional activator